MYISTSKKIFILIVLFQMLTVNVYAYDNQDFLKRNSLSDKVSIDTNVYIVVLNRTNLDDILSMDNIKTLAKEGCIGLMNTRGMYGYYDPDSYMTINCSSRAYANNTTSAFFNIDKHQDHSEIYKRRLGSIVGYYEIVNIEFNKLLKQNADKEYSPYIGALGENLHKSGYKTAVFGNSDTADNFIRTNCLIATDSRGLIDYGNVDEVLIRDETYPFGLKTDYSLIVRETLDIKEKASLIVFEVGDLNRLSYYSENLNDKMYSFHRNRIIDDANKFIGSIIDITDKDKDLIIILSPNAADSRLDDGSKITPIVVWGKGVEKGILSSGTTRRKGIISNIDIAPSISKHLNSYFINYTGNPITYIKLKNNIEYITELSKKTNSVSKLRYPVLSIYNITTILVISILTISFILKKGEINSRGLRVMKLLLMTLLACPLGFLILSLLKIDRISVYILYLIIYLVIINFVIMFYKGKAKLLAILGTTYFIIIVDILKGGDLIKFSTIGYDPIIGARYFGIGNELVGVLLTSMILSLSLYINKTMNKPIIIILSLFTSFLVAHPNFGANVGGTISIVLASLYFGFRVFEIRINIGRLFLMLCVIIIIIASMTFIDINYNSTPSHLGRAFITLIESGPRSLLNIIIRKLQVNIRLIGTTIWAKTLLICVGSTIALIYSIDDIIRRMLGANRYLSIGIVSSVIGSTIGFIVNDSGILLASISNIYITTVLIYATICYVENNVQ